LCPSPREPAAPAVEYDVNRKTIRRRLDAAELADAERARRTAAKRAGEKRMKRLLGPDYRNPEPAPEHRRDPPPPSDKQSEMTGVLSRQPSTARLGYGGVPMFPNTPAERLAYYEARKLNHLPNSLLDYHDVIRDRETPAERRARERRTTGRRR
jgi:hypothetical protein